MAKNSSFQNRVSIILVVCLLCMLGILVNSYSDMVAEKSPPGAVMIDLPAVESAKQMPPVRFLHDRHTDALKGRKDCSACHLKRDDSLVFKFKRLEDKTAKTNMDIYHVNCIGCHQEQNAVGESAGPVTGQCRACHVSRESAESSSVPIHFSKSLHYRHESSALIKPSSSDDEKNCSACHHQFNEADKKLYYKKGEEGSCVYCHKGSQTNNVSAIKTAAHSACINCHIKNAENKQTSGPVLCVGCHDRKEQEKIKKVEAVPRLNRNQPDVILLWDQAVESQKGAGASQKPSMNPVAFDHLNHEKNSRNCRTCHHASLDRCGKCHSKRGAEEGQFISLEQAMHDAKSEKSCIGCHRSKFADKNCAGCHALIPEKRFDESSCTACHSVSVETPDFSELNNKEKEALAKKALGKPAAGHRMLSDEHIPETVTIGIMQDKYEPVKLPHRRIVHKLSSVIKESKIAGSFHQNETTLCAACHHHTAPTKRPPACVSCHGIKAEMAQNNRPGLKGAYHGQCIICHQKMEIQKPAATDCAGCHPKRSNE